MQDLACHWKLGFNPCRDSAVVAAWCCGITAIFFIISSDVTRSQGTRPRPRTGFKVKAKNFGLKTMTKDKAEAKRYWQAR